ncbi:MAG: DinB family protein, partial [Anaerolineaceae bacterium]|nr:DinB family protein [Anaerolineaceae bacterium]
MSEKIDELFAQFIQTQEAFDTALKPIPDSGLDWREGGEGWSIRQIIHHVAEDCNVYAFIIERALATPGCKITFGEFPGNEPWGERLGWDTKPVEIALELMHVHRKFIAEMVSLLPDQLDNEVHYFNDEGKELGKGNVENMLKMLSEHMEEHTATIQRIAAEHQA